MRQASYQTAPPRDGLSTNLGLSRRIYFGISAGSSLPGGGHGGTRTHIPSPCNGAIQPIELRAREFVSAPRGGFEPPTFSLTVSCAAVAPPRNVYPVPVTIRGLNIESVGCSHYTNGAGSPCFSRYSLVSTGVSLLPSIYSLLWLRLGVFFFITARCQDPQNSHLLIV